MILLFFILYKNYTLYLHSQLLQWGVWRSWAACEILSNCVCAETQSVALWVLVSLPKKAKLMQSEEAFPACLCQINQKPHKTSTLFSNYNSLLSFNREILPMFCKSMQKRMPILSQSGWPHFDSDSYGPLMKGEKAGYQSEGEAMWNCSVGFWKAAKRKRKCLERTAENGVWRGGTVGGRGPSVKQGAWQWSEGRSSMETACSHSVAH